MAKAKVNIPYPDVSIKNPVVYNWKAGTGGSGRSYAADFWERRRRAAFDSLASSYATYTLDTPELKELGRKMSALGEREREKEIALLQKNLPSFNFNKISDQDLITQLNILMRGKEQFLNSLSRIKAAISQDGKEASTTKELFKGLAPSMASHFLSYLGSQMSALFRKYISQLGLEKSVEDWGTFLEDNFDKAVDNAMKAMLEESSINKELDNIYGDAKQWKAVGEAYRNIGTFQKDFKEMIRAEVGFDNIKRMFENGKNQQIVERAKMKGKKSGFRTYLDKNLKWKTRQASIGGSVAEFTEAMIINGMPDTVELGERASIVVKNKKMRTDQVVIFSYEKEGTLDVNQLAEDLNLNVKGATGLTDAANRLSDFYEKNLKNLKDSFIMYISTKNYSLGNGFSGFHNGKEMPLERLTDYSDAAGISQQNAQDFIHVAYNTLKDAVFEDKRGEVQENLTNILKGAAAKLMFDDWETIGVPNPGAQVLHAYDLDGVIVPASYVFRNLGKAMEEANEQLKTWFSVSIRLPQTVVYEPGDWRSDLDENNRKKNKFVSFGTTNEQIKEGIYHAWHVQAIKAEEESYFSVKFLYNFKTLMMKLMKGELE